MSTGGLSISNIYNDKKKVVIFWHAYAYGMPSDIFKHMEAWLS